MQFQLRSLLVGFSIVASRLAQFVKTDTYPAGICLSLLLPLCLASSIEAVEYHGRFNIGLLAARERFTDESDGSSSNDVGVVSSRIYLDASELTPYQLQFVADVRDKHDFFDKLDRERLELVARNRLQTRQLFLRWNQTAAPLTATLGRFSAADAGVIYTDGLDLGLRLTPELKWGVLGGYTPRFDEGSALETTSNSQQYGTYITYLDNGRRWSDYIFFSNLFISVPVNTLPELPGIEASTSEDPAEPNTAQQEAAQQDPATSRRNLWVNNTTMQWGQRTRLTNLSTVGLNPKPIAENLWFSWFQNFSSQMNGQLSYLHVDPFEYHRQQELRETLPSSQYRQGSFTLRHRVSPQWQMLYLAKYGKRTFDQLEKKVLGLGIQFSEFFSSRDTASIQVHYQQNFVSNSIISIFDYGFFSQDWEFHLSQSIGVEKHRDIEKTLYPTVTQVGSSFFWSRLIFSTASLEWARDENVDIYSLIAKIGYRFGSKELPPIRDGAPPRGRL